MIYANEYGTVDLLSEQFLQSLKSDKGTIGVKLSGGADTALLLYLLAKEISENKDSKGIIMCGTGNGVSMVANKYKGVRAGLCWSKEIAELVRKHNNANVLSLPARFMSTEDALEIVRVFLMKILT